MNCKILFFKKSETFRTSYTSVKIIPLDYSGREERFSKESMCDIEPRNVADITPCTICCPSGGDFIKEILREMTFTWDIRRKLLNENMWRQIILDLTFNILHSA